MCEKGAICLLERLQKVLAAAGYASRRKCEQLILDGRVSVNGKLIRELGFKVDAGSDQIKVDHRPIVREQLVYLLLHKPRGVVTTVSDPQGRKTVMDLIQGDIKQRVFPVGRLDLDTSGLLLLTNDGKLANGLMHPKHEIHKTYLAKIEGRLSTAEAEQLRQGVLLEDGMTAPAQVAIRTGSAATTSLEITIHEGRNRQVRRMCEAVGHPVASLMRIQVAFLKLGQLPPGHFRQLSKQEVQRLYAETGI
ncbi:MAG: pseudouridine synthase [Bacilli bacterium]|nr:pseudouridine synthase [Bacilli bacterium]